MYAPLDRNNNTTFIFIKRFYEPFFHKLSLMHLIHGSFFYFIYYLNLVLLTHFSIVVSKADVLNEQYANPLIHYGLNHQLIQ